MDVLTVEDLADLLRMTKESLYTRRCRDPRSLPQAIRIGRRLVWRRETVERWLEDLEREQARQRRPRGRRVIAK